MFDENRIKLYSIHCLNQDLNNFEDVIDGDIVYARNNRVFSFQVDKPVIRVHESLKNIHHNICFKKPHDIEKRYGMYPNIIYTDDEYYGINGWVVMKKKDFLKWKLKK